MDLIKGQVWSLTVPIEEIDSYINTFRISSIQLLDQHYVLRIISEKKPSADAVSAVPRLEAAYIYLTDGSPHDTASL